MNWNGWRDTIECLESVFRLRNTDFTVLVCDNASTDGSLEKIKAWARGELSASVCNQDLAFLTIPPVPKPISFDEITSTPRSGSPDGLSARLILIQTGCNLGFAGGNNVGLRYALAQKNSDLFWLLNNDTVVDPNALLSLVQRMQQRPDAGMCGSTLLYYDHPRIVQALGGSIYNQWTARGGHIGLGQNSDDLPNCDTVERQMKYVVGASMIVSRVFLEQIGLMSEAYFLYSEEIDWATRARGRFSLAYAPLSIVYHKEGGSIGTSANRRERSSTSDYYSARSRMLYTRKYFPGALFLVVVALLGGSLLRCVARNKPGSKALLRALRDSLYLHAKSKRQRLS